MLWFGYSTGYVRMQYKPISLAKHCSNIDNGSTSVICTDLLLTQFHGHILVTTASVPMNKIMKQKSHTHIKTFATELSNVRYICSHRPPTSRQCIV